MAGSADGVRNLDDSLAAIQGRMLPGSQIMLVGSPNIPFGPVFELDREHFGRPSEHVVVIHGRGPLLNPVWWTPERIEKMRNSRDASVQRSYVTDVLGKFADSEDQLISSQLVDAAMRSGPDVIAPMKGHSYVAAMDPAMRGNAWTLVVLGCDGFNDAGEPRYYVALDKQWRGSKVQPLRPDRVLREIARDLKPYGLGEVWSDGHQLDSLRVIAEQEDLEILEQTTSQDEGIEGAENIRILLESERLQLSTNRGMRADLLRLRRKVNQKNVTLNMPVTADGRHCDFIPPLRLCLKFPPGTPFVAGRDRDPGMAAAIAAVDARKAGGNTARSVFFGGLDG